MIFEVLFSPGSSCALLYDNGKGMKGNRMQRNQQKFGAQLHLKMHALRSPTAIIGMVGTCVNVMGDLHFRQIGQGKVVKNEPLLFPQIILYFRCQDLRSDCHYWFPNVLGWFTS